MYAFITCLLAICLAVASFAIPRPEYPRPDFQRADWINLNGEWTYTFDFSSSGLERQLYKSQGFNKKITVPFCPESSLSGVEFKDFIPHIWYHRTFKVPTSWSGKRIMLNFGAVYYQAEIYVDGQLAGRHFGGSSSFTLDVTSLVKVGKQQNLVVYASSDVRKRTQSAGKQCLQYAPHGCNYTRTTGIWQTVWMEAVNPAGLHSVQVIPDIDQKQLILHPRFHSLNGGTFKAILRDAQQQVIAQSTASASSFTTVVLPVNDMKTWSPESPYLYSLTYQVLDVSGKVIDEVSSYAGMRKIHIQGNRVYLNNRPYFQRLVLDQGFYPDGIWTAPSDEALKKDIELAKQAGFNGARLHQKVFEPRFHYWADRLGYLTWGEAPSWGMDCNLVETARNFLIEWSEVITRDRNHPSIVMWTPLNEEFYPDRLQYPRFVQDLYQLTKTIDPTRPFHDASGGTHIITDIWSVHHYEQDPKKLVQALYNGQKFYSIKPREVRYPTANIGFNDRQYAYQFSFPEYRGDLPFFFDEFGGIRWNSNNPPSKNSWGYGQAPTSLDEFYTRLTQQVTGVISLYPHIQGYCYTQLTDVEQEQNGIYCYDRTPKFDMGKIRSIFSQDPIQETAPTHRKQE